MGERATCPVCGSYSSSVLNDISNGKPCHICKCPNEYLRQYQEILIRQDQYSNSKVHKKILEENDLLVKENFKLKAKISLLIDILGYDFDSTIIESLKKVIKILHD